jgi:predicted thioesterase
MDMKNIFKIGDRKEYRRVIGPDDVAAFHGKVVHPVCATFALARDIEWTSRLFVLQMCEDDEEGIGTMLTVHHRVPRL